MTRPVSDVALALDRRSLAEALDLVDLLGEAGTFYKVGLELFTRSGPRAVEALRARDKRVFLDLKLHDIPATVAGAVQAAAGAGVELLTVHVAGGPAMMEAASRAAAEAGGPRLVGVTVLTSLGPGALGRTWGRPVASVEEEVVRLASLALEAGLDGVVASAREAEAVRAALGAAPLVVTPGIRLAGGAHHDQVRVTTPARAARAGADCLVVGRAVTAAADPPAALAAVLRELVPAGGPHAPAEAGRGAPPGEGR